MKGKALPLASVLACLALQDAPPRVELRGAWIRAGDLTDPRAVAEALQRLSESGFNAVFPPAGERLTEFLVEGHRHGLEVLPWFEPAAAGEDATVRAVLETCRGHDLDGVVGVAPLDRILRDVAALDPELSVVVPAGTEIPAGSPAHPLPAVAERPPEKGGDVLFDLGPLLEKDAQLARALREGAFAEDARLPWRKSPGRRAPTPPIEPLAGPGVWTWTSPEREPRFLAMDGGEAGHVTWTFEPPEAGVYALYAWIPAREDLASRASFKIASAGSSRTIGIDASEARNRGWVFLGDVRLVGGKPFEVARLEAEEQDATKITAAGPLLVLRSRRARPR